MTLLKERRKSVIVVKSKSQVVRREEEEAGEEVEEPEEEVIQRDSIYVFLEYPLIIQMTRSRSKATQTLSCAVPFILPITTSWSLAARITIPTSLTM